MDNTSFSRRTVLRSGLLGLAAVGAGRWTLSASAEPTAESGDLGAYGTYLEANGESAEAAPQQEPGKWQVTQDNILGPFYREGSPFRGKVTPPLEPGVVMLIAGRVWGHDTRKPLAEAVLDIWQASATGRYDNDDPRDRPAADAFTNRARIVTDQSGYYEFETIHPGAYRIGARTWRPPHIHYLVRAKGYRKLVTQLYFQGDPHQDGDPFIKPSLVIGLQREHRAEAMYERGRFDIVLARL